MQKKWRALLVICCLLLGSGCAKRVADEKTAADIETSTQDETASESPRFIYAGVQGSDETGIATYNLLPEKNKVEIGLSGIAPEDWRTYTAKLISFKDLANGVEFVYINEDGEEVSKSFEILSDSIVIDEEKNRYEWM